jgi:hypothetical protein
MIDFIKLSQMLYKYCPMKIFVLLISFFSSQMAFAQVRPRDIRDLSALATSNQLVNLMGREDVWSFGALEKLSFISRQFLVRPSNLEGRQRDRIASLVYDGNVNLAFLEAQNASDLKMLAPQLRSERLLANSRWSQTRENRKSMLFFLLNLTYGNTHYEKSRFVDFQEAIKTLAERLEKAVEVSRTQNLPIMLELQTSVLQPSRSPVLYNFAKLAAKYAVKTQTTPPGGKIIVLTADSVEKLIQILRSFNAVYTEKLAKFLKAPVDETNANFVESREELIGILKTGSTMREITTAQRLAEEVESIPQNMRARGFVVSCPDVFK